MPKTHEQSGTYTYRLWKLMRRRCNNTNSPEYPDYGGRGIKVCVEWDSYVAFLTDMGTAPDGLTLERRNNSEGYSKDNCLWATRQEQSINRRKFKNNASGTKGVYYVKRDAKWMAQLRYNGKLIYGGTFDTYELAVAAREGLELTYHGFKHKDKE